MSVRTFGDRWASFMTVHPEEKAAEAACMHFYFCGARDALRSQVDLACACLDALEYSPIKQPGTIKWDKKKGGQ